MSISGMKEELDALERFYEHSPIDKPVDLVAALRKAIQDIEKYHKRKARTVNYVQHEWIGLTDEERADCWSSSAVESANNIEQALKDKNT
jgi:hypothetical protein